MYCGFGSKGLPKQEELIYKLSNVQTNTLGIEQL